MNCRLISSLIYVYLVTLGVFTSSTNGQDLLKHEPRQEFVKQAPPVLLLEDLQKTFAHLATNDKECSILVKKVAKSKLELVESIIKEMPFWIVNFKASWKSRQRQGRSKILRCKYTVSLCISPSWDWP